MKSTFPSNLALYMQQMKAESGPIVLGLDIFDTLLVRRVDKPADVFLMVDTVAVSQHGLEPGLFVKLRTRAEREARIRGCTRGRNEVTLAEIYETLRDLAGLAPEAAAALQVAELEAELQVVAPRLDVLEQIKAIAPLVQAVYLISDTYLDAVTINKLLRKANVAAYTGKFKLVLSSQENRTKHDGELIEHVLVTNRIDRSRFLYIGDNIRSDVVNASKSKVRCLHVNRLSNMARKAGLYFRDDSSACVLSALLQGRINIDVGTKPPGTKRQAALDSFGFALAPLWLGFLSHMKRDIEQKGIDKVFFLARDGHSFARLWSAIYPELEPHYLHISREVLYKLYFHVNFKQACALVQQNYTNHSLEEAVERLFDEEAVRRDIFASLALAGYDLNQPVNAQAGVLDFVVATFKQPLLAQAAERYTRYMAYLEGSGLLEQRKVAVMDLGWHGSLQRILAEVLRFAGRNIELNGYYLALFGGAPADSYNSYYNGYLCDRGSDPAVEKAIRLSPSLIELLHAAPHGSTSDVDAQGKPVLRANDVPAKVLGDITHIQGVAAGAVIDVINSRPGALGTLTDLRMTPKEAFALLAQVLENPSEDQVRVAAEFSFCPDYGLNRPISLVQITGEDMATSHWKVGTTRLVAMLQKQAGSIPSWFVEDRYLTANPDVAQAVLAGQFLSGYDHYQRNGKHENRKFA